MHRLPLPRAIHMPSGNFLDDIRLDMNASFHVQNMYLESCPRRPFRRNRLCSVFDRMAVLILQRLGLHESLVMCGLMGNWFEEFNNYWSLSLGGRPLTVFDFHNLKFEYRKRFHRLDHMTWDSPHAHIENYQRPENLYCLFEFVLHGAKNPVRSHLLFKHLQNSSRVLEFGCSLAPMYQTWRRFLSHIQCNWVLADLPNYPFHMCRHLYGFDEQIQFHTIKAEKLDDPLEGVEGDFDIIIVQEVFEHLHKPLDIARYLIRRLKPNGRFIFDYIRSNATGHDTLAGLTERKATLEYIGSKLTIIDGLFEISDNSVGLCVGMRQ